MVTVAPTLAAMAEIYLLSREGGPRSPRFLAYLARVEHEWGLSAYNPMAGPAALETVRCLVELDAESLAGDAAREVSARCGFDGELTLAVVVASKGMWTDRVATEVQHRTPGDRRAGHGIVLLWTGDTIEEAHVRRESAAEAVRAMWTTLFGAATTLGGVLAREGLAYALSSSPFGPITPGENARVREAIDVLGDTSTLSDIAGILYGDATSVALGWAPLGLAEHAGFRWAVDRAKEAIARAGPRDALHATRTLASGFHGVP